MNPIIAAHLTAKLIRVGIAAAVVGSLLAVAFLVIVFGGVGIQKSIDQAQGGCGQDSLDVAPVAADIGTDTAAGGAEDASSTDLAADQVANARTILAVAKQRGVPAYGWVIALATALQESGLRNLPYGDRDSLGLFQQRPSQGWGTPEQLTDPAYAARQFFTHLLAVPGWQQMSVTAAAQAVQRSGFPDAYADHEDQARTLVATLAPDVDPALLNATYDCSTGIAGIDTDVVPPLPAGTYRDLDNYGHTSSLWASIHTGDDLSAPCGTPVLAVTSGTIVIESGGSWSWAGRWLVKIQTAPGALTTWYGHMQALTVTNGQQVTAGQQIGQVGALGNATGCHLHLEVHPHGGGYLQDQVDPQQWLAQNIGQKLAHTSVAQPVQAITGLNGGAGGSAFRVASFNVLGASHTGPGGDQHPGWPSGPQRIVKAVALLDAQGITVAGLQEFESPQLAAFRRAYAGHWATWFPDDDSRNAIIWRADAWQMLDAHSFAIPYITGTDQMPVVLLQNRTTGAQVYFVNVHNPSNMYGSFADQRAAALRIESRLVDQLLATGLPLIFTGDFNDTDAPGCAFAPRLLSAFGTARRSCGAARGESIDHIFGARVTFTDTRSMSMPHAARISDHDLLVTTANVGG